MAAPEPVLVERQVTLEVSRDTMELWQAMARSMNLSFDAMCQVLVMYGAYLMASADLGYLEGLGLGDLNPQRIQPTIKMWLEQKVGSEA